MKEMREIDVHPEIFVSEEGWSHESLVKDAISKGLPTDILLVSVEGSEKRVFLSKIDSECKPIFGYLELEDMSLNMLGLKLSKEIKAKLILLGVEIGYYEQNF